MRAAMLGAPRAAIGLAHPVHIATAQALCCGFLVGHPRRLAMLDGVRMPAVSPFTLDDILGNKPS
jgi:hypothetical protein